MPAEKLYEFCNSANVKVGQKVTGRVISQLKNLHYCDVETGVRRRSLIILLALKRNSGSHRFKDAREVAIVVTPCLLTQDTDF
jgi:hypothetical protein